MKMVDLVRVLRDQNEFLVYKTARATKKFSKKFKEHIVVAITSALGLIIGLSWKEWMVKNYYIHLIVYIFKQVSFYYC